MDKNPRQFYKHSLVVFNFIFLIVVILIFFYLIGFSWIEIKDFIRSVADRLCGLLKSMSFVLLCIVFYFRKPLKKFVNKIVDRSDDIIDKYVRQQFLQSIQNPPTQETNGGPTQETPKNNGVEDANAQ